MRTPRGATAHRRGNPELTKRYEQSAVGRTSTRRRARARRLLSASLG